jgi:hypothetical protein
MMFYVGGIVAAFLVWAALVSFAIKLGASAKSGAAGAWFLIVVAALGAVISLVLALLLGVRAWELREGIRPPRRPSGGRRARR